MSLHFEIPDLLPQTFGPRKSVRNPCWVRPYRPDRNPSRIQHATTTMIYAHRNKWISENRKRRRFQEKKYKIPGKILQIRQSFSGRISRNFRGLLLLCQNIRVQNLRRYVGGRVIRIYILSLSVGEIGGTGVHSQAKKFSNAEYFGVFAPAITDNRWNLPASPDNRLWASYKLNSESHLSLKTVGIIAGKVCGKPL